MGSHKTITVCHLISGDLWAGAEVQSYMLLRALRDCSQLRLSAVVLNHGRLADELRGSGIDVTVIDERKYQFATIFLKANKLLSGQRTTIIHSHRYKENLLAFLLKKSCDVDTLIQTVHGGSELFSGIKNVKARLYDALNWRATRRFDRVISVSNELRNYLSGRTDRNKVVTIHNAIEPSLVVPRKSIAEVRKRLRIDDNCSVIGSVGRMVPVKGFDRFLRAARRIHEIRPDVVFVLVGDGPLLEAHRHQAQLEGLGEQVRFVGYCDDVWDVMQCFDIFVMTSLHEGIPMTLLEAMVLGRPVVSMGVGGIPEVIEHEISGMLVQPGDVPTLANVCLNLLGNPEWARKLGGSGKARVHSHFSTSLLRDSMLALYKEVARTGIQ